MTFIEAISEVLTNKTIVWRRAHEFEDDYDRPFKSQRPPTPWSEWLRIRLDDDPTDFDALVFFETNNRDDVNGTWILEWKEDNISRADILAEDWEIAEE
jgi:hypothetical protein